MKIRTYHRCDICRKPLDGWCLRIPEHRYLTADVRRPFIGWIWRQIGINVGYIELCQECKQHMIDYLYTKKKEEKRDYE